MPLLDLSALEAFVLVSELRSFTHAADALGSTQSAVSLKLKRLEAQLGRTLLERTPRLVRLSTEGQHFLPLARDMLDRALIAAEMDDCYQALKLARQIMRQEDAVLGRAPVATGGEPAAQSG